MLWILNGFTYSMLLFLVAAGLSLIFGFMRIINFAHGAFFILGSYFALSIVSWTNNFWIAFLLAPIIVGLFSGIIEAFLVRRVYNVHHAYQIILLFGVVLSIEDLIKIFWGAEQKIISTPAWLKGAVTIGGQAFPTANLIIIVVGLLCALGCWLLFIKTKVGATLRAVSSDRELANALGHNVSMITTLAFMLGGLLAGIGGVLLTLRGPFTSGIGWEYLIFAFAVVVIGGLGSFAGCFVAALIVGYIYILGAAVIPQLAMSFIFLLLVVILILRPTGLFGMATGARHEVATIVPIVREQKREPSFLGKIWGGRIPYVAVLTFLALLCFAPLGASRYQICLLSTILIMALFATSVNMILGFAGMLSFGQASLFAVGSYSASLLIINFTKSWPLALLGALACSVIVALIIGVLSIRHVEIYFAMLTLAFGQLVYTIVYKWTNFTGGSDGLYGIPPLNFTPFGFNFSLESISSFYYFLLIIFAISIFIMRRIVNSSFGQILKAIRENPTRMEFVGINLNKYKLIVFVIAGLFAGVCGAVFAPFNTVIAPEISSWVFSGEIVVVCLLGGIGTFFGPIGGAFIFSIVKDIITGLTEYWMLCMGTIVIALVIGFPEGVLGFFQRRLT